MIQGDRLHAVKVMEVIVTTECRGEGTPDNIAREVTKYWTLDGQILAEHDPYPNGK